MTQSAQRKLEIIYRPLADLRPFATNPRRHTKKQQAQIAASIKRFGFTNPILVSDDDRILAGHGRVEAAKALGMTEIPTVQLSQMNEDERRAYVIADNKLALNAGWDVELLAGELKALTEIGFDVEITGFALAEIDFTIEQADQSRVDNRDEEADKIPPVAATAVTRLGDVWEIGRHRLLCGDARHSHVFETLMGQDRAHAIFTDPPTTCRSKGMYLGWVVSVIAILLWPREK